MSCYGCMALAAHGGYIIQGGRGRNLASTRIAAATMADIAIIQELTLG